MHGAQRQPPRHPAALHLPQNSNSSLTTTIQQCPYCLPTDSDMPCCRCKSNRPFTARPSLHATPAICLPVATLVEQGKAEAAPLHSCTKLCTACRQCFGSAACSQDALSRTWITAGSCRQSSAKVRAQQAREAANLSHLSPSRARAAAHPCIAPCTASACCPWHGKEVAGQLRCQTAAHSKLSRAYKPSWSLGGACCGRICELTALGKAARG